MTALGFLYPGHSAEDDYPRMEQLLGSDVRLAVVHTDIGEDAQRVGTLREMGSAERLAAGVQELRLTGAEAAVWACTSGGFVHGWDGAHEQVRALARTAGMPASSTSFAFAHALAAEGARRVAVAATYPEEVAALFGEFLAAAGFEVVSLHAGGARTAAEVGTWGATEVLELARAADVPEAEVLLLPDTALHTVAHLPLLERELGKTVLTANQVTAWEGLRLAGRRVNAPSLGALFTREPIVQARE
ncbi:decarboxylase [Streptomyces sp. NPDC058045]|uniref:maleate cis-trans isomerase family protein n=1 Tax=Streptomyces sp. NPDC058045 TaxID=3346311 RepID=UPI0036EDBE29